MNAFINLFVSFAIDQLRHSFKKPKGRNSIGHGPSLNLKKSQAIKYECDFNSKYRRATGTCNNRNNPLKYGVAYNPFRRYAAYYWLNSAPILILINLFLDNKLYWFQSPESRL